MLTLLRSASCMRIFRFPFAVRENPPRPLRKREAAQIVTTLDLNTRRYA